MQFIERSVIGVRSAVYTMSHAKHHLKFVLFPMSHIGEPAFYDDIRKRILECDVTVLEGIKSEIVNGITKSYKGKYLERIGLIEQADEKILEGYTGKILHKDLTGKKFDKSWHRISVKLRYLLKLILPFIRIQKFLYSSRKRIARKMNVTDLKTREDILKSEDAIALDNVILEQRDYHLIAFLEKYINENSSKDCKIGIMWGAAHMPSIAHFLLNKRGYFVSSSEWVTVFKLDE